MRLLYEYEVLGCVLVGFVVYRFVCLLFFVRGLGFVVFFFFGVKLVVFYCVVIYFWVVLF